MYLVAFPKKSEYEKMRAKLNTTSLPYEVVDPEPGYGLVGIPAIVMEQEVRSRLASNSLDDYFCSGWVEYRRTAIEIPQTAPRHFQKDIFGAVSIMVVAPCIADQTKIRLITHISGDMSEVFPYLNAEMRGACYNTNGPMITYMDGYRMITLYPRRIAIAKADEIVDGWRTLEKIRCCVNDVHARRDSIVPLYIMRKKPPAFEIYKRLPGTNCGGCGQRTCMAFALTLWNGNAKPFLCKPIFEGDYTSLKDAFLEICAGLGVTADGDFPESQ